MSNALHFEAGFGRSILSPTLFGALHNELRESLLDIAPLRQFSDGQLIQQRGEDADGFWVIEEGIVLVGVFGAEGNFRTVAQLVPGDSYGELAVLAQNKRAVDAIARGEAKLRWISAESYRRALENDPENGQRLVTVLALQLQELIGIFANGRSGGVVARIAAMLLNLTRSDQKNRTVLINQQQLGDLLGLTRASINAGLKEIEAAGAVERGYGKILVRDAKKLTRLAQD